jgi:hypothetical protein
MVLAYPDLSFRGCRLRLSANNFGILWQLLTLILVLVFAFVEVVVAAAAVVEVVVGIKIDVETC